MKPKEFFDAVVRMREKQQEYFKTKTSSALTESKRLERVIDDEIESSKNYPRKTESEIMARLNQRACGYCMKERGCSKRSEYMKSDKRHTGGTAELAVSCSEFIHFNTDKDHETERKRLDTSSR